MKSKDKKLYFFYYYIILFLYLQLLILYYSYYSKKFNHFLIWLSSLLPRRFFLLSGFHGIHVFAL